MLLRTLGELNLKGSDFSRPKPLLLLAYLALEGPKPRRYLAELFFMDTKDPFNGLSQALKLLRKNVPGAVEADTQKVWATLECDAAQLLNLADKGRFEECVALYKGPFAEVLNLPLGVELEDWIVGTREYLAGRVREALLDTAEQKAHEGSYNQGTTFAEVAYTLTGASELELEQFERIYTLLSAGNSPRLSELREHAQEYGIVLSVSSQQAKARLQIAPSEGLAIRNNLPPPKTSFIGREHELHLIADQLANPECRLLTLHGMGGIGKSKLAVQAAHSQLGQEYFKDGVFFVPLEALRSAESIPESIAEVLALDVSGQSDALTYLKQHIGKNHVLLVLDNYEHLLEWATLPSELLQACAHLKVLVTSREVLCLEEEWVTSLSGLSHPVHDHLNSAEAQLFEAVNLFVQRAKRVRSEFTLTHDHLNGVLTVCRLVGGSPLGIELAAAWVNLMPPVEIATELRHSLDLSTTSRNKVERHQSMRAVFEHSWNLLTSAEQNVLEKLSVFRGGFKREAASSVADATLAHLVNLVRKSFLTSNFGNRYTFHPLLHQYLSEKAAEHPAESAGAESKHGGYYLCLLEGEPEEKGSKDLKAIDEELTNVEAAWHWAVRTKNIGALRRHNILRLYCERQARFREGVQFFSQAIEGLDEADSQHRPALGAMFIHKSGLSYRLGRWKEAGDLADKGLALLKLTDTPEVELITEGLNTLGAVEFSTGTFAQAKVHFREALRLVETLKNETMTAALFNNLAQVEQAQGFYGEAETFYFRALGIHEKMGDPFRIAVSLKSLGQLKLYSEPEEAHYLLMKGLKMARKVNYQEFLPQILDCLAASYLRRGDCQNALGCVDEALQIVQTSGEAATEAALLLTFGKVSMKRLEYGQAAIQFEKSLEISWSQKNKPMLLRALFYMSKLAFDQRRFEQANELLEVVVCHPSTERVYVDKARVLLNNFDRPVSNVAVSSTKLNHNQVLWRLVERILEEVVE